MFANTAQLVDLRNPSVALDGEGSAAVGADPVLGGLLGSLLGETPAQKRTRLEEATKGANDLTGMVRHRKKEKVTVDAVAVPAEGATSKRKLEDGGDAAGGKKARVDQ